MKFYRTHSIDLEPLISKDTINISVEFALVASLSTELSFFITFQVKSISPGSGPYLGPKNSEDGKHKFTEWPRIIGKKL
jgi:hypothetical protein